MKRDITIEGEIGTNRDWKKLLAGQSQRWPNGVSRWVRADAGWGSVSCQILLSWSDSSTLFWHACQIFLLNCRSLIYAEFLKKKCTLDANSRRAVVCVGWPFDANSRRAVVNVLSNSSSLPPKRKRDRKHRRERRTQERENKHESFIHDASWDNQSSLVPASSSIPVRVTQSDPQGSDPILSMWTAVYPPLESVGNSAANENSPFQIGLGSREFPGLYKPTAPDPNQDTWAYSPVANSSELGPPSPTRTSAANSSDSRIRTGIVYPLQPRSRRLDVCIEVEASLPEPAALLRPDLRQPEGHTQPQEAPANLPRTFRQLSCKRRRNRCTAVFRPAKRSPPRGHWCDKV